MSLINTGIEKGLIKFDDEKSFITYIHQNKDKTKELLKKASEEIEEILLK